MAGDERKKEKRSSTYVEEESIGEKESESEKTRREEERGERDGEKERNSNIKSQGKKCICSLNIILSL